MPFTYPTSVEIRAIEPDLIQADLSSRLGMQIMPIRDVNVAKVRWTQQDNFYGLQALRGMDGQPAHVQRVGNRTYEYEPGVFGEYIDITETELVTRAGSADVASTPISIDDLVVDADKLLIQREDDRIESSIWTLLTTGVISITLNGPNGTQIGYRDSYTIQTYSASISWATVATAVPIRNFQAVQQLGVGHSVDFGSGATAYMNSTTVNNLINNTNAADLGGKRIGGGSTVNTIPETASLLLGLNLPRIAVYDGGYIATSGGGLIKFIPDNKVVVVGRRTNGARIGEYLRTRNASNGFRPGPYRYVIDRANGINAEKRTPANIEIHRGHNGGPTMMYPSAVVVMTV